MKGKIASFLKNNNNTKTRDNPDDFDNDQQIEFKVNKGVNKKIQEKSELNNQKPLPNINQRVKELYNNEVEQRNLTIDLTSRLYYIMKDKTLEENKTQEDKQIEISLLNQYNELARVINASDTTEESQGTLTFALALSRCLLFLRNRINELEYQNANLKDELESLRHKIDKQNG